jgi:pimeloyl-ACP methyl ester carboxylesterase/class 3 adenylate cyclase
MLGHEIGHTLNRDASVAYQVFGQGPDDLMFLPDRFTNLDSQWEDPAFRQVLEALGAFRRVIMFDKRGVGLSDPVRLDRLPSIDDWATDAVVVLDAVGSSDAHVVCGGGAGMLGIALAANHPDRVRSLTLLGSTSRVLQGPDYEIGLEPDLAALAIPYFRENWGTGEILGRAAPDRWRDPAVREWFARFEKQSASRGAVVKMQEMLMDLDLRARLPEIRVPTLIVHRSEDAITPVEHARYLASKIAGSELRELPGSAHLLFGDNPFDWIDELREFCGDVRVGPPRVLSAILCTDIVDSTRQANALGDRLWDERKERHDQIVRETVRKFGGILQDMKLVGDGHMSRFQDPEMAVQCAFRLTEDLKQSSIEIRSSVHFGKVERARAGISGSNVHLASRICERAGPGETLVSSAVVEVLQPQSETTLGFEPRGEFLPKGFGAPTRIFRATKA